MENVADDFQFERRYYSAYKGRQSRRDRGGEVARPSKNFTGGRRTGNAQELRRGQVEARKCREILSATDSSTKVSIFDVVSYHVYYNRWGKN